MTQIEFEAILSDTTKRIAGDIAWAEDEDHSPALEFRAEVTSQPGYPLLIKGSFNAEAQTLTFALINRAVGRIYGLDLGKDHHNPDCVYVGERHKHQWREPVRDKEAYVPGDITALPTDPVAVWQQFCREANIQHEGVLQSPPPRQKELF
jgi:hypothetical protein